MTGRQMLIEFTQILESKSGYALTPILSQDIYYYLNSAIRIFVDNEFAMFEQSATARDNLKPLVIKEANISTFNTPATFSSDWFIDTAPYRKGVNSVLYLLNHRSEIYVADTGDFSYEISNGKRIPATSPAFTDYTIAVKRNRESQHDDILTLLRDPFNKSESEYPLATVSESGINVYTDSTFIVNSVIIDYLKEPTKVDDDNNSELPDFKHKEIVETAVNLYLTNSTES